MAATTASITTTTADKPSLILALSINVSAERFIKFFGAELPNRTDFVISFGGGTGGQHPINEHVMSLVADEQRLFAFLKSAVDMFYADPTGQPESMALACDEWFEKPEVDSLNRCGALESIVKALLLQGWIDKEEWSLQQVIQARLGSIWTAIVDCKEVEKARFVQTLEISFDSSLDSRIFPRLVACLNRRLSKLTTAAAAATTTVNNFPKGLAKRITLVNELVARYQEKMRDFYV